MRLFCINAKPMPGDVPNQPILKEGETYTAVRVVEGVDEDFNEIGPCYALAEIDNLYCYQVERFIPLSDEDGTAIPCEYKFETTSP